MLRKRKELEAAERDLREGIAIIEDMRAKTIPMDFMKRGFTDLHQSLFAGSIELLSQQGRWQLALETAEQARARAFLDLLASRGDAQARRTPPARHAVSSRGCSPQPLSGALAPLAARPAPKRAAGIAPGVTRSHIAPHHLGAARTRLAPARRNARGR